MTVTFGFVLTYDWITASSNAFWNEDPPPWTVLPLEPEPPLLPQAASTVARPTTAASTRGRLRVAFKSLPPGRGIHGAVRRAQRKNRT